FLCCSRGPRSLPSFPTRRSSDLSLRVFLHDELSVVFEDVGHAVAREDFPPQVVGLEPVRIGRIARAIVPALVERQKPRRLPRKVDRKSTRLNSSHVKISYAVFCL